MTDDALKRFENALVETLRERGTDPAQPFTVAEIYQDLVPYRTQRDRLETEMNGDYEHLLLRVLTGEGGILELESTAALNRLLNELDESNPNTGVYRDFAAVDVHLTDRVAARVGTSARASRIAVGNETPEETLLRVGGGTQDDGAGEGSEAEAAGEAEGDFFGPGGATDPDPAPGEFEDPVPNHLFAEESTLSGDPAPQSDAEPVRAGGTAPAPDGEAAPCRWCRQTLPQRENLNFCPFCGSDARIVPCDECGEALEPEWRFCISCGTEVPVAG